MITYMDYLERCYGNSLNWNPANFYENISAASENLLDFKIPSGARLNVSSNTHNTSFNTLTISNNGVLGGSLAYLYSSIPLRTFHSEKVPLEEVVQSYRSLETPVKTNIQSASLLYGKIHLPSRCLEAMVIRNLSPNTRLVTKCVNIPKSENRLVRTPSVVTLYWQQDRGKFSREIILSSHENLLGGRFLYNWGQTPVSLLSMGAEIWYSSLNMSPGISTALRYTTQSHITSRPLTLTLSCNPLLGHVSASYAVKTSPTSSYISRYDFNVHSYQSDLSIGCDLWRGNEDKREDKRRIFNSVFKAAASLNSGRVRLLWEGKFKKLLLSSGAQLRLSTKGNEKIASFGFAVEYSS